MEETHYIGWIELATNGRIYRNALKPGYKAEVQFDIKLENVNKTNAREYCNIHGLWKSV